MIPKDTVDSREFLVKSVNASRAYKTTRMEGSWACILHATKELPHAANNKKES
jgi:hypothetical protein